MNILSTMQNPIHPRTARLFSWAALLALLLCLPALAQSGDATLAGIVEDSSGALLTHAPLTVTNTETGVRIAASTNARGLFSVAGLTPGRYKVRVQRAGFATVEVTDITLAVGDKRQLEIKLPVAQSQETVQVDAGGATLNTTNPTVGTVIDREFVNGIPLNGRSFQPLILLAPGVVTASPQGNDPGQFSVNGQRTNSNYYMVDGVSANNGADVVSSSSTTGMLPSGTALGTTQAILPVDALQEFRIATSTYSVEYGRQPGAQITFLSRSGTNSYHGAAFEYLRNTIFDANNWFNTYTTPAIPRLAERQNDFGGFVSGPLSVPRLYSGKDRAFFFFFAYEGLRAALPTPATIIYVPSNGTFNTATYANAEWKNVRQYAPAVEQPALNAFPLPNCSTAQNPQCVDYGDELSPYLFSGSYPSVSNSLTGRVDVQAAPWAHLFARYSDSPSSQVSHITNGLNISSATFRTRVFLLGADTVLHGSLTNELRLQYSPSSQVRHYASTADGGAQPNNLNTLQGLPAVGGESIFILEDTTHGNMGRFYSFDIGTKQFQPNAVDAFSWIHGTHSFKAGADYRQTTVYLCDGNLSRGPGVYYIYNDTPTTGVNSSQILKNAPQTVEIFNDQRQDPTTKNLGLFFQDEWRIHPRLTLSLGLRWDLDPPPSISGAQQYTYTGDINNPSTLALSRQGAPLYQTVYTDFQPRAGFALLLHRQPGSQTILRAGAGLFYDNVALYNTVGSGFSYGADYENTAPAAKTFPEPVSTILAPIPSPKPPYALNYIVAPNVHPPSTAQWNVTLEQTFGARQSVSLAYVGAIGMDLINWKEYSIASLNPLFSTIVQYENGPGSNYNAMQAQFKRQAFHGLQLLASYTWSHAIDSDSTDFALLPVQRGNSSHDVRNNFAAAAVYKLPTHYANPVERAFLADWSLAAFVVSHSAFPVLIDGPTVIDAATGDEFPSRLNYNGGNPYVRVAGIPGGRQFNPAVFSVPTTAQDGAGNAPRNFLRGFGENSADTAVQRVFSLHDQLRLAFRAEAFNVFNHPNFGALNVACGTSTAGANCNNTLMGQATNTLSNALTGAASIYQEGGPRSLQFTLRLEF